MHTIHHSSGLLGIVRQAAPALRRWIAAKYGLTREAAQTALTFMAPDINSFPQSAPSMPADAVPAADRICWGVDSDEGVQWHGNTLLTVAEPAVEDTSAHAHCARQMLQPTMESPLWKRVKRTAGAHVVVVLLEAEPTTTHVSSTSRGML